MQAQADVLIVTVTKTESQAVFQVFQEDTDHVPKPLPLGKKIYHDLGIVNEASVFMVQSEMGAGGLGAAQQTVQKGITALSPSAVIMVGIAFGTDTEKQSLGDILVSQRLLLYELQRVGTDSEGRPKLISRGDRPHASPWLFNLFQSADMYWDESIARVRFGLILSGEKLVDNVDFREQLRDFEPEAIGGEMEGAGLYVACQDEQVHWILVKAICDWADGHKDENRDERQRLAASNAARFVLHGLKLASLKPAARLQQRGDFPPHTEGKEQESISRTLPSQQCSIDFASLLEPDDLMIELMFQEFFRRAATVVRVTATTIRLPSDPDEWDRFRAAVKGRPIVVNWPPPIMEGVSRVDEFIGEIRQHMKRESSFHGIDPSWLAQAIRGLEQCQSLVRELLSSIPKRLPWLWLSLLDYCSPYPSTSPDVFRVQRNYLRFASLRLYRLLVNTLRSVAPDTVTVLPPLTEAMLSEPRWEHNISLFFEDDDEVAVAYVTNIAGLQIPEFEVCIYGPRGLATQAHGQSLDRRPIISPWFMQYLVPQVELLIAAKSPDRQTSYRAEATIRKVTDLSGNDIEPERRKMS